MTIAQGKVQVITLPTDLEAVQRVLQDVSREVGVRRERRYEDRPAGPVLVVLIPPEVAMYLRTMSQLEKLIPEGRKLNVFVVSETTINNGSDQDLGCQVEGGK